VTKKGKVCTKRCCAEKAHCTFDTVTSTCYTTTEGPPPQPTECGKNADGSTCEAKKCCAAMPTSLNCVYDKAGPSCREAAPAPTECGKNGDGSDCTAKKCCKAMPAELNCGFDPRSGQCYDTTGPKPEPPKSTECGKLDNGRPCESKKCCMQNLANGLNCRYDAKTRSCSEAGDEVVDCGVNANTGTACNAVCCNSKTECFWLKAKEECVDPSDVQCAGMKKPLCKSPLACEWDVASRACVDSGTGGGDGSGR